MTGKQFAHSLFLLHLLCTTTSRAYYLTVHDAIFVPDEILRVSEKNISMSCASRYSVVVNGTLPGPVLRIPEGKTTWIRVFNDMLDQNLTMHWHGLSQMVAPFSDGTPAASQWPIPPLHWFDYEVHPEKGSAGTYFYHSHVGFQANTATGALIVEEQSHSPYSYDEERIVLLSDYFTTMDNQMGAGIVENPFQWIGETNNILVNGFGRQSDLASTPLSLHCSIQQWRIRPNTTYRFRFIGATGLTFTTVAFQGHKNLTIIEADGEYTKPLQTNYLQIGSGQRYSVLLRTKSLEELAADNRSTYFMQLETRERPTVTTSFAALSYIQDALDHTTPPSSPPLILPNTTYGWLDYSLSPLEPDQSFPPSSAVNRNVVLRVNQLVFPNSSPEIIWTVNNNTPWLESYPKTPYLVALYENATASLPNYTLALQNGGYDPNVRAFAAEVGEVIDIVIQAIGLGPDAGMDVHPFHLHGVHFWDLGSGNGTYDAVAHEQSLAAAYKTGWSPPLRDTTMMYRPPGGIATEGSDTNWRAWRIRVIDPGVWMLHCHTLVHMAMGMQSVWVMGNKSDVAPLPKDLVQGYLTYGGNAYGSKDSIAQVLHWFDD